MYKGMLHKAFFIYMYKKCEKLQTVVKLILIY